MLKLFRFLKPYWGMIAAVLVLVFLQTLADLFLPTLMSDVIDKGVMNGDTALILRLGGRMLLFAGGGVICAVVASFLSSKTSMGFGRIIRNKVFEKVESFSLHEFDKFGTATLITRSTNDITQVQMVTMIIMRMMVAAPMMAVGGIIMAMSKDKPLTLVFVVALPVLIGAISLMAVKGLPFFRVIQTKIDRINLVLRERLTGIRVIRAFNRVAHEKARFEEANADLTRNYIKINRIMAFLMPTLMLIMNFTTLAILWFGIKRIDSGSMEMGSLIAFTQYAFQILFSMVMVSMMFIMVPRAQAAAVRINEVLGTEPEITDAAETRTAENRHGYLEFRNVSFSYHGAEQPALDDISFTASPGEVTAIIGGTGAGKSSMLNLIPRFYDVESGAVLIDGVDVREMSQEYLRSKIGFVPQKAVLFSGTITDNIRFGNGKASGEEITAAAETAQAMEFISSMDLGFDHEISQGGTNVSGGQKQRLSIARALARKPEILIFDDSFSALDFKTDSRLRGALKKLLNTEMKDVTVLIVAQRVGTVMDADRIIVLDDGRISGTGTHEELLHSCQIYREIVSSQFAGDAAAAPKGVTA
ncbi:MAG: ABC transporter ATP-binding protein [Spirochaetales bacterium]|nr:MAG: ABC transporter ATP-binding protein [Spirochaetales bacterium]